jgi:hypothetical protein
MTGLVHGALPTGPALFRSPIPFAAATTPYPEWADAFTQKASVR